MTPDGRSPYKPLTRERFLHAKERYYQDLLKQYPGRRDLAADLAKTTEMLQQLTPEERQATAIVRDPLASPIRQKLFVTEAEGGRRLVTIDGHLFESKLPRHAVRVITVYWEWNEENLAKAQAIRLFKDNFDFQALRQLLDR